MPLSACAWLMPYGTGVPFVRPICTVLYTTAAISCTSHVCGEEGAGGYVTCVVWEFRSIRCGSALEHCFIGGIDRAFGSPMTIHRVYGHIQVTAVRVCV